MINIYAHSSCAVEFRFEELGGDLLCGFGSRPLRAAWPPVPSKPSRAEQNVSVGREQGRAFSLLGPAVLNPKTGAPVSFPVL